MNTVNKLWEKVIDFENIYHAYRAEHLVVNGTGKNP